MIIGSNCWDTPKVSRLRAVGAVTERLTETDQDYSGRLRNPEWRVTCNVMGATLKMHMCLPLPDMGFHFVPKKIYQDKLHDVKVGSLP